MINQVIETVKESINREYISRNQLDILEATNEKLHSLIIPYAGPECNTFIKSMNNNIQRILLNNVKARNAYIGRKPGTKFPIKDLTKTQYEHDLIYYSKCVEPNFNET